MVALAIVFFLWGLFVSFGLSIAFKEGFFFGIIILAVAWGPLSLLIWFFLHRTGKREKAHEEMLASAGVQPSSGADHSEDGTGIAINRGAKTLTLMVNGFYKTYPFSDLREWETKKERAGEVVGVGLNAGVAAMGANARAAKHASANTGLFVFVKDVDNPRWRIAMKDEGIQARWMEILRQEVNEA